MAIITKWLDKNKRIILVKYEKNWTISDFRQMIDDANILSSEITHPYVTILDYSEAQMTPKHITSLYIWASQQIPKNLIGVINLRQGHLLNVLAKIFLPLFPTQVTVFQASTSDEAVSKANQLLSALPTR